MQISHIKLDANANADALCERAITDDESDGDLYNDDFFLINSYMDPTLVLKIEKGEYVDLAKLLLREKSFMMMVASK